MNTEIMFSKKSDEWSTPQDVFDKLNDEFHFTLDAAATQENAKCEKFFTIQDDALLQQWGGTVWCNPPFSKIKLFVRKARMESLIGNATVVMLLPVRSDTKWFHEYIYGKAEIRFFERRLKFSGNKNPAPFPCMVVVFRKALTERRDLI